MDRPAVRALHKLACGQTVEHAQPLGRVGGTDDESCIGEVALMERDGLLPALARGKYAGDQQ
jgi:hypothetical protein